MAAESIFVGNPALSYPRLDVSIQAQTYVRDQFWPDSETSLTEYVSYFRYFRWAIETVLWPNTAAETALLATQTYKDLATVVRYLEDNNDKSRTEIADGLHSFFPQSPRTSILRSMDLAVRLWMMLHLRSTENPIGPQLADVAAVEWKPKQSLRNLVASVFPKSKRGAAGSSRYGTNISIDFTIMNIRRLCRIEVAWTQNLRDHLKFDPSGRVLYIYPHKVCLISHLEQGKPYPKDFLLESLRTLDLLFPYGDKSTEDWLEKNNQPFHRTSSSHVQVRARNLDEFRYWNRQLSELYFVFLQPPTTVSQMWYDRRNPIQWYTFWLAAVIAVLTVLFGSLGTYIGFKQIELAQKSM
ncbi:hypothetical protein F5Y16DRAFT_362407 [Xylariaceae sp. FL0255]|nr:hypothetical protein F5Y16DRAFT_362407 [Xylariaceae sp. FL0255]